MFRLKVAASLRGILPTPRSTVQIARDHPLFLCTNRRSISTPASSAVNASSVRQLRDLTGAGMMDCKKALSSCDGDMEAAVDWLKKKGIKTAANQMNRSANEGLIGVKASKNKITFVEINSETDFVARNEEFQRFVEMTTDAAHKFPIGHIEPSLLLQSDIDGVLMNEKLLDAITKIRENIVIRRVLNMEVFDSDYIGMYAHRRINTEASSVQLASAVAVVKATAKGGETSVISSVLMPALHKLAMHVVAAKPKYLSIESVPKEEEEREFNIAKEQTENDASKKAGANLSRIIDGKVKKRLSELCLLQQQHLVESGAPIVEKYLASIGAKEQTKVVVTSFYLWSVGQTVH